MKRGIQVAMMLLGTLMVIPSTVRFASTTINTEMATNKSKDQNINTNVNTNSTLTTQLDGNWMYLSQEQRVKDFDYLYNMLKENYPYFGVSKRSGFDLDQKYLEVREKVKKCKNDEEFFELLNDYCGSEIGHIDLWGTRYFEETKQCKEWASEYAYYGKIHSILDNEVSKENYAKMLAYYERKEEQALGNEVQQQQEDTGEVFKNVETRIIEKDKIAYMAIHTFDMNDYEASKKQILDFYKEVKTYPNLIIDIRNNGGGGMSYYDDLIVGPNITKPVTVSTYYFLKGGENNKSLLSLGDNEEIKVEPIEKAPYLPHLNALDRDAFDYFVKNDYTIHPLGKEKLFNGHIWMLVNERNYSSSEYAAMFSKESGFATLVGRTTGGDGIGVDPLIFILPESGLVVQYGAIYGTTKDGKSSEEFGTTPDIVCDNNEDPLKKCIEAINAR